MFSIIKLYHYVHCPYCVRVRMALGYLGLSYESIVLRYDDERTPVELTKSKMLPIATIGQITLNESLDIIELLDQKKRLSLISLDNPIFQSEIENLIDRIGLFVHPLAMPYWIYTAEFDSESREYFISKKSIKRGPFKFLVKNKKIYIESALSLFSELEVSLMPYYKSNCLTIADIMISSQLWGLYVVPEFQFPTNIHQYLQRVATDCNFNYHEDYWR